MRTRDDQPTSNSTCYRRRRIGRVGRPSRDNFANRGAEPSTRGLGRGQSISCTRRAASGEPLR